jgi:hypothetical protein
MNTVVRRKLSSVIASKSIAKNICKGKYKDNIKPPSRIKQSSSISQCNETFSKRQKKTHYNEKMEPIRLSGNDASNLPKRIREVVWTTYNKETYSSKCYVPWCENIINVFNYQVGHDIPESKGGTYDIDNLRPICSNCNLSMGNKWTIQEWSKLIDNTPTNTPANLLDKNKNKNKNKRKHVELEDKVEDTLADKQPNKLINRLELPYDIAPEMTSRITFITLLFLALKFMIF